LDEDSIAFPDRSISSAAIRNHPLLAEPDVFGALGGGEVVMEPESPDGLNLHGGASDQTSYAIDGIPVFSPYHAAGLFSAWNPDAIARMHVYSSGMPELSDALSGVVSAETRNPGERASILGTVSTTQARLTLDGPLGAAGAGYLLSLRSGFPDAIAPKREGSHLRGETGDLLVALQSRLLGGHLRLLGYESENELDIAALSGAEEPTPVRNGFAWRGQSLGAEWSGRVRGLELLARAWSASFDAGAGWDEGGPAPATLTAGRHDEGAVLSAERRRDHSLSGAGIRVNKSRTFYDVAATKGASMLALDSRMITSTMWIEHERALTTTLRAGVAFAGASLGGDLYGNPRATLRWAPSPRVVVQGGYTRSHQFAQSLRNAESIASHVFPADLYLGTGGTGIPIARSDLVYVAAEYRPSNRLRVSAQAYDRGFDGLLLVAPRTGDPFSSGSFTGGDGTARGGSVEGTLSSTRYAVIASYGWQHLRMHHDDSSYVPRYGVSHMLEGGAIVFPSATSSIKLGVTSLFGRRATPVSGVFEWDSCNLLDRGCELSGTPRISTTQLGSERLPPYVRVDLGARKHWHLRVAGREAMFALFGTVTNVLNRKNVLTISVDPETGRRTPVEMRSRAPLVIGLDWSF
jgi:hypothetical protein